MKGKYFLDTNIFVYSFDNDSPAKRDKAKELISGALSSGKGSISYQVVQEFLNVSFKKFKKPLSIKEAQSYLSNVLIPICEGYPSPTFYSEALEVKERTGYSLYDSLILQAARDMECKTLYSEDMHDGFKFYDLTIKNPFK